MTLALSVLDLVPVRTDQTTADAVAASRRWHRCADELGYRRYWVAEHHNMPAVAATNPPVLIAPWRPRTSRIRVGSGGVMLPNHEPLVVAEQFALLEALFPGRIDLGIGRAPGTDMLTRYVLRGGATVAADDAVARFPQYVDDVATLMHPDGVEMAVAGRREPLRATPHAASVPTIWLLGSSDYSARLAAARGLPYVFAHHFAGQGTAEALELYRSTLPAVRGAPGAAHVPDRQRRRGRDSTDEARRLALPQAQAMVALRTGGRLAAQRLIEEAEEVTLPPEHQHMAEAMLRRWVVDEPDAARERVEMLAKEFDVDEVMVHPVAGALAGTPVGSSPRARRPEVARRLSAALARPR